MNIYIYSSCLSMSVVYHPYIHPHFNWWPQFHRVVILVWSLRYGSVVCKFQFEKYDVPCKHASRVERVLLHVIKQVGQKQTGEFLLRPQESKANSSVNLSTNLLRFCMVCFHLITKRHPLSTNVLCFHIRFVLVEGGFVFNTCSFVQFYWPMTIRSRIIKKKRNF